MYVLAGCTFIYNNYECFWVISISLFFFLAVTLTLDDSVHWVLLTLLVTLFYLVFSFLLHALFTFVVLAVDFLSIHLLAVLN